MLIEQEQTVESRALITLLFLQILLGGSNFRAEVNEAIEIEAPRARTIARSYFL